MIKVRFTSKEHHCYECGGDGAHPVTDWFEINEERLKTLVEAVRYSAYYKLEIFKDSEEIMKTLLEEYEKIITKQKTFKEQQEKRDKKRQEQAEKRKRSQYEKLKKEFEDGAE